MFLLRPATLDLLLFNFSSQWPKRRSDAAQGFTFKDAHNLDGQLRGCFQSRNLPFPPDDSDCHRGEKCALEGC